MHGQDDHVRVIIRSLLREQCQDQKLDEDDLAALLQGLRAMNRVLDEEC